VLHCVAASVATVVAAVVVRFHDRRYSSQPAENPPSLLETTAANYRATRATAKRRRVDSLRKTEYGFRNRSPLGGLLTRAWISLGRRALAFRLHTYAPSAYVLEQQPTLPSKHLSPEIPNRPAVARSPTCSTRMILTAGGGGGGWERRLRK